jgi:hypothetical protein
VGYGILWWAKFNKKKLSIRTTQSYEFNEFQFHKRSQVIKMSANVSLLHLELNMLFEFSREFFKYKIFNSCFGWFVLRRHVWLIPLWRTVPQRKAHPTSEGNSKITGENVKIKRVMLNNYKWNNNTPEQTKVHGVTNTWNVVIFSI